MYVLSSMQVWNYFLQHPYGTGHSVLFPSREASAVHSYRCRYSITVGVSWIGSKVFPIPNVVNPDGRIVYQPIAQIGNGVFLLFFSSPIDYHVPVYGVVRPVVL